MNVCLARSLSICLAFAIGSVSFAQDFPELFNSEPESDKTLMSPEDAAKSFVVPEGFEVSVFASEPDVQNPIAMAWDAKGRLWIAENYTYAERGQKFQLDLRDRVVILDNTGGKHFKKRTVFTDNVQMLTGIEVGRGGVWLMCPPKLIFIPDADGDDVPDNDGKVILDGFTVADANYHNFANGLKFGPDGWLYGRCGGSCPGRIGLPGTPDDQRVAMEGGIWRYHPETKQVEVLTSGTTNPWGHDWNEVGEMFYCNTVNGHLWHMIPGAHFTRPFLLDPNPRTYKLIDFHADHWHFDTGQSWTKSRNGAANEYGGGHAHIGTMIYQGTNWPKEYHGNLFTLNQHGRRANQEILQRDGSGYVAKHGQDILLSKDIWFQGIDLGIGPDGGVFILDWSDTGECHEHTGVHRTSGRIFKVTHRDAQPTGRTESLFDQLTDSNPWVRKQARLSAAKGLVATKDVSRELRKRFENAKTSADAVQLLFGMRAFGVADGFIDEQLDHADPHVRAWCIRMMTESWPIDDTLGPVWRSPEDSNRIQKEAERRLTVFRHMAANDESPLVRLALASTLQRLPVEMRASLAAELVTHAEDADDHNLPMMIWYGLIPVANKHADQLVDVAVRCKLPETLQCISRCLAEEIETQPKAVDRLLANVVESNDVAFQRGVLSGVSLGLKGWRRAPAPAAWQLFSKLNSPELAAPIRELNVVFGDGRAIDELKEIALGKTQADHGLRLEALKTLIQIEPDDLRNVCERLLGDNRMNVVAAHGLSKFDDPTIGDALVKRYRNFRAPFRPQVISILSSRKSFATKLLEAIDKGKIQRADLSAFQVRQIHSFGDKKLSALASKVWGEVRESSEEKKQAIKAVKTRLTSDVLAAADKSRGRELFEKSCQNCHRLYGTGGKIGPDLTGSGRDNMDYLLSNIIDPSGVVDKAYRMTVIQLDDGRVINGLVTGQTNRTLTIHTATESVTMEKSEIERQNITEKSPMPEGLIDNLTPNQVRDLLSYLQHPTQVPLPGK